MARGEDAHTRSGPQERCDHLGDRVDVGPFVLAGHSSGGVYAQAYAATYPNDVAGLVLIDSQPATALTRLPQYPAFYNMFRQATGVAPRGPVRAHATDVGVSPGTLRADKGREESAFQSTADQWRSLHDEMTHLSTNRVMPNTTHAELIEDKAGAAISSRAVTDAVQSVRSHSPLPATT